MHPQVCPIPGAVWWTYVQSIGLWRSASWLLASTVFSIDSFDQLGMSEEAVRDGRLLAWCGTHSHMHACSQHSSIAA